MQLKGIGSSEGIAIAPILVLKEIEVKIEKTPISNPAQEFKKFQDALAKAETSLDLLAKKTTKDIDEKQGAIFRAHIEIARDPLLSSEVQKIIELEKVNALYALNQVANQHIKIFLEMDDEYMRERAVDIKDVTKRIIDILAGVKQIDLSQIKKPIIIASNDISPSQTAQMNSYVKGFMTEIGGKTSHAAIIARSRQIPAVLGVKGLLKKVKNNQMVALDGQKGLIWINPQKETINQLEKISQEIKKEQQIALTFLGKKTLTKDQHQVELAANIGNLVDLENVLKNDAEAIGLFRSEFIYMDGQNWPSEEKQFKIYQEVLKKMSPKMVVIRTLDIGGDKTLPYFKFEHELNPFLGYRAIRFSLAHKEIFKTQLRALIRASFYGKLAVMFPMIATLDEFLDAKKFFQETYNQLVKEKVKVAKKIEIGMMVEIPTAAILADQFAKHADFLSIGTNDLLQYSMAHDRMNQKVSYLYQPLNPAILRLIKMTIDGAHAHNKWVGMCGEMAGDSNAIPILLGLGLDEFSMTSSAILKSRHQISKLELKKAKELAKKALELSTEKEVLQLVYNF